MLNYLKNEANKTYTENGAATYLSTGSECVDLFGSIGAIRNNSEQEIITRFVRAFTENPDIAMKILFFARDVRGGLGERRVFRTLFRWLAVNHPESVKKNISYVADYGRFDDLLVLIGTPCQSSMVDFIKNQLAKDVEASYTGGEISLLAKWLPSVNASDKETVKNAKILIKMLGTTDKEYRKTLSMLRTKIRIIENNLREKDYTFDYSKQPSKAMFKYREAFRRNDGERYNEYLQKVAGGEVKMNTATLMPYELIRPYFSYGYGNDYVEDESIEVAWNNLEDFTNGENALAVIDGSGSMYSNYGTVMPVTVAMSLGIYFAEHNKGAFANHFITFSENPQLVELKGESLFEKVKYCETFNEVANTNIQKVFELILNTAVKNSLPQSELPSTLYFITDMEFDYCTEDASLTNFEYAKKIFEENGYKLPRVVFWNVESRNMHQPVKQNEQGVALVSGCTPAIFSMVADGSLSPYKVMMDIISSERYKKIAA